MDFSLFALCFHVSALTFFGMILLIDKMIYVVSVPGASIFASYLLICLLLTLLGVFVGLFLHS